MTRVDQIGQSGGNSVAEKRVDFGYNGLGQYTDANRYNDTDGLSTNKVMTSSYQYDSLNRLANLDYKNGSGADIVTSFSWGYDGLSTAGLYPPLAERRIRVTKTLSATDRVLWPIVDHLGTVRDLVKQDGTVATHFVYDAFGGIVSGNTSLTRYLFMSREYDMDTGLQYNRARWYDANVGRWTSEDPLGFGAGDVNTARYVGNGVVGSVDPSGLSGDVDVSNQKDGSSKITINDGNTIVIAYGHGDDVTPHRFVFKNKTNTYACFVGCDPGETNNNIPAAHQLDLPRRLEKNGNVTKGKEGHGTGDSYDKMKDLADAAARAKALEILRKDKNATVVIRTVRVGMGWWESWRWEREEKHEYTKDDLKKLKEEMNDYRESSSKK